MEITGCFKRGSGGSGRQASFRLGGGRDARNRLPPVITWGKYLRGHLRGVNQKPLM